MKKLYKEGKAVIADDDQLEAMLVTGWSADKPTPEPEAEKPAETEPEPAPEPEAEEAEEKETVEEEAPVVKKPAVKKAPKKIPRRASTKKKE